MQKMSRAFTLIELLVVVGIIAILAAMALPNFLAAQTRAKVSRAKADLRTLDVAARAYMTDWNRAPTDANDTTTPPDLAGLTYTSENPQQPTDIKFLSGAESYHTFRALRPLTTPVAYMSFRPIDPFSRRIPIGYNTRELTDRSIAYAVFISPGPDGAVGDWIMDAGAGPAIGYDPTNGTTSKGDLWRAMPLGNPELLRQEYGPEQQ